MQPNDYTSVIIKFEMDFAEFKKKVLKMLSELKWGMKTFLSRSYKFTDPTAAASTFFHLNLRVLGFLLL